MTHIQIPRSDETRVRAFHQFRTLYGKIEDATFRYQQNATCIVYSEYDNVETEDSCEGCDCDPNEDCECEREREVERHDPLIERLIAFFCGFETTDHLMEEMQHLRPSFFADHDVWYFPVLNEVAIRRPSTHEYWEFSLEQFDNRFTYGVGGFSHSFRSFTFTPAVFSFLQLVLQSHLNKLCRFVLTAMDLSCGAQEGCGWKVNEADQTVLLSYHEGLDVTLCRDHILLSDGRTTARFPIPFDQWLQYARRKSGKEYRQKRSARIRALKREEEKMVAALRRYGRWHSDRERIDIRDAFLSAQRARLRDIQGMRFSHKLERRRHHLLLFSSIFKK